MPLSPEEARALYDSGAPVAQVAAALDMDAREFLRHRRKHGWPLRPSPIAPGAEPATRARKSSARKSSARKTRAGKPGAASRTPTKRTPAQRASPPAPPSPVPTSPPDTPAGLAPVDVPAVRRQVETAVQVNLACVQNTLASGDPADVERNARLLASLVKSLAELRRLEALEPRSDDNTGAADGNEDERPPRDIETLRDELARALERMSVEPAGPQAGG